MIEFNIVEDNYGQTLEKFVKKILPDAPLSFIYKLFRKKDIKVNNHWQSLKYILNIGDNVKIYITDGQLNQFKQHKAVKFVDDISSWIIYEDKEILIVNKPRNILVQQDAKNECSLDEMVLAYLTNKGEYDPNNNAGFTPGPAHRIDRNTSGIVVFGKTIKALQTLFNVFKNRNDISKHYIALVKGNIDKDGEVVAPLKKDESAGKVIVADKNNGGKPSKTIYHVIQKFDGYTLLELILITGRTHQIRVHMSYIGHPIIGDAKYGDFELNKNFIKKYHFRNQFLHASEIHFGDLPEPLEYLKSSSFKAKMPTEFENIIENLCK